MSTTSGVGGGDTTREAVASVLLEHRPGVYESAKCECGHPTSCDEEWANHAAEAVVQALGLTEERGRIGEPHIARLVTPWVSVREEQP